jgi:hypothetical protein
MCPANARTAARPCVWHRRRRRAIPPPDPVVAVPTYLLNGRVVSLGNPYPEELFARLHEVVE